MPVELSPRSGDATASIVSSGGAHRSVRRFSLVVLAGPDAGVRFLSSGLRTVVGTHRSCQLVLTDPTVSRFHAEISIESGRAALRDLHSKNGTWVDGLGAVDVRLARPSEIVLGNTRIGFELRDEWAEVPLAPEGRFGLLVGPSEGMRGLFAQLLAAARSDVTVLIEGETGTGKDLLAESLHRESSRGDGPLVVVDCGSIAAGLIESELFGHERGAFTGATADREGAFEAAHGGTLLLDEIGELPLALQPKLLRVLESRTVKRIGSGVVRPVDCRIVAATNRNLKTEVNARRFRSDLYYRLAVLSLRMPPLRERLEDLAPLIDELVAERTDAAPELVADLRSPARLAELARYSWPGNVRELRNYVERYLSLRRADPPGPAAIGTEPARIDVSRPLREQRERWTAHFERVYLTELLRGHGGNVAAAARAAGVARVHLHRLIVRSGLKRR